MTKKISFLGSVCTLLFASLLFSFSLVSCSENQSMRESESGRVISSIEKLIKKSSSEKRDNKINLASLSEFDWDRLFIYAPYTPTNTIEKELGFVNVVIQNVGIEERDDISLLVFMNLDKVVKIVPYPRGKGDFSTVNANNPILRDNSTFFVMENPEENGWFYLKSIEK